MSPIRNTFRGEKKHVPQPLSGISDYHFNRETFKECFISHWSSCKSLIFLYPSFSELFESCSLNLSVKRLLDGWANSFWFDSRVGFLLHKRFSCGWMGSLFLPRSGKLEDLLLFTHTNAAIPLASHSLQPYFRHNCRFTTPIQYSKNQICENCWILKVFF